MDKLFEPCRRVRAQSVNIRKRSFVFAVVSTKSLLRKIFPEFFLFGVDTLAFISPCFPFSVNEVELDSEYMHTSDTN